MRTRFGARLPTGGVAQYGRRADADRARRVIRAAAAARPREHVEGARTLDALLALAGEMRGRPAAAILAEFRRRGEAIRAAEAAA